MALKISTGLRDHMLVTGTFKTGVDGGVIRIYDGTVPATADAALSGNNLLCVVSLNQTGAGINMGTVPASGVLGKATAEVVERAGCRTGTASFYRFSGLADAGASSTTEKRLQGTCAAAGGDLNFSSVAFVANGTNTKSIDTYNVVLPTA